MKEDMNKTAINYERAIHVVVQFSDRGDSMLFGSVCFRCSENSYHLLKMGYQVLNSLPENLLTERP
jgi:hypothetical protein